MQKNKDCFQWLAQNKKKKKRQSLGERNENWNYMSQKEETEEMDGFRSQLGLSPGSFILSGAHFLKGGMAVVPLPHNRQTRLQKMMGTLLGNSASVQKKLGSSLFFISVFLKLLVIAYEGFIIPEKLKT